MTSARPSRRGHDGKGQTKASSARRCRSRASPPRRSLWQTRRVSRRSACGGWPSAWASRRCRSTITFPPRPRCSRPWPAGSRARYPRRPTCRGVNRSGSRPTPRRDLAREHPGAFPLLATRASHAPALVERVAVVVTQLRAAGFTPAASARAFSSFITALNGFLLAAGVPAVSPDVPEPGIDTRPSPR